MKLKSLTNKNRYGNMFSIEFFEPEVTVPMMMMIPDMPDGYNGADTSNHPGDPKGTDTVPAWLTPGENVVNAEASRIPGNQEMIDQMNEEGRMIQKAQGGPIPTYESDGGFISGLSGLYQSAVDAVTLPPAPPGIVYRRLQDGSIGQFTERKGSGGGQKYLGKLEESKPNRSSRKNTWDFSSLYNSDGGKIPRYANTGMLAEFLKEEEGLRNEAYRDPAGVPTIGYGSTYGVKMGDKLSDAEANQQLIKDIAVVENDYNNLVDVELNPNQQTAVKSLLFNIGGPQFEVSKARAALNAGDFDTFQKEASEFRMAGGEVLPGLEARRAREMELFRTPYATANADQGSGFSLISKAQASDDVSDAQMLEQARPRVDDGTRGVPPVNQMPPKPEEDESFLSYLTPSDQTKTQIKRAFMYPAEFLGVPVPLDAPGVPNATLLDMLPDKDRLVGNFNSGQVKARQAEADKIGNKIKDNQAKGLPVSSELINAHKAALAKVEEVTKIRDDHAEKIANENEDVIKEAAKNQTYDVDSGEFKEPKDEQLEDSGVTNSTQYSTLKTVADSVDSKDQPPPGNEDDLKDKGDNAPPDMKKVAINAFKDAFGDLFSPKELARMALVYTGSRLMGYDHNASFAYSAKTYMGRIEAAEAQYQKDIRDDDYLDFTEESRKEFEAGRGRDYTVLQKKAPAGVKIKGLAGNAYLPGIGKVQVFEGDDKLDYVEYEGKLRSVASLAGFIEPWDESVQGRGAMQKNFSDFAKEASQQRNSEAGLFQGTKDKKSFDDRVYFNEKDIGDRAETRYREILRQNGVSINDADALATKVQAGIDDFIKAKIAFSQKKSSIEPRNVRDYIDMQTREVLTGIPMEIVGKTSPVNMRKLDNAIKRSMTIKSPKQRIKQPDGTYLTYAQDYYNQWQGTYQAWAILNSKFGDPEQAAKFNSDAANRFDEKEPEKQWSAFTLWASKTEPDEIERLIGIGKKNNLIR